MSRNDFEILLSQIGTSLDVLRFHTVPSMTRVKLERMLENLTSLRETLCDEDIV